MQERQQVNRKGFGLRRGFWIDNDIKHDMAIFQQYSMASGVTAETNRWFAIDGIDDGLQLLPGGLGLDAWGGGQQDG
ncbi:hypothetical protein EIKCOROL_00108 [Eikenella corrodens ATCC 23834]|uniref:Uncharacterized protein n=1 Tax=Eikenella corrodens ATCC 23834 TaxID=546274 RepID=C0DRZ2_EIKCO|nr:hypothetical protein EIKCOROL_00108 [Eikenella corrodens ATCC 23834]OAM15113.1 hypothetical protein A7P84_10325 [Eikenella corrodens]